MRPYRVEEAKARGSSKNCEFMAAAIGPSGSIAARGGNAGA
jgi:hypothetical protein